MPRNNTDPGVDAYIEALPDWQQAICREVRDLVAYLQWMGEPAQGTRVRIGVGVLVFLGLLIVITWRLNSAYWRTVH